MADPYGISGESTAPTDRPPRWDQWNQQHRQRWRQRNTLGMGEQSAGPGFAPTPPASPLPGGAPTGGGYFVPGFNYGAQAGGLFNGQPIEGTPFGQTFFNENFGTAYDVATAGAGIDPTTAFGQFVTAQRPYVERALAAARAQNPMLDTMTFLRNYVADMRTRYNQTPALLRGENPRAWGQGELRQIPR